VPRRDRQGHRPPAPPRPRRLGRARAMSDRLAGVPAPVRDPVTRVLTATCLSGTRRGDSHPGLTIGSGRPS
jgi:hypothetical protein